MSKRKNQLLGKPTQEFTTIGTADGGNLGDFEPGHNMRIFSQNSEDWTILISLNIELRGSKMCGALLGPERCLCRIEEKKMKFEIQVVRNIRLENFDDVFVFWTL